LAKVGKIKSVSLKKDEDGLISFALDGATKIAKEQKRLTYLVIFLRLSHLLEDVSVKLQFQPT